MIVRTVFLLLLVEALCAQVPVPPGDRSGGEEQQIKERDAWFIARRGLDRVNRPDLLRRSAIESTKAAQKDSALSWQPLGPSPMQMVGWIMGKVSGRITDLEIDPRNDQVLYLGSAAGGLWKSLDGGQSWHALFDTVGTQTIGSIELDPQNPDTVWVGSGEPIGSCGGYFGLGLFRSDNGGASFSARNGDSNELDLSFISAIAVHPEQSQTLLVGGHGACHDGNQVAGALYRTTDGGESWNKVISGPVNDVLFDPNNPTQAYAAVSRYGSTNDGIYKSTNSGQSWVRMTSGLPSAAQMGRSRLVMAPSDSATLYALIASGNGFTIYQTTNSGSSWQIMNADACEGQCWYNMCLAVSPNDVNHLVVGSIRFADSIDGGRNLTYRTSGWGGGQRVHQDTHVLVYDRNDPNRYWIGSDGGIWRTDDNGSSFVNLNGNLNITQFYDIAVDPDDVGIVYGGAQDNSSSVTENHEEWELTIVTGDGFVNLVDPANSDVVIQTSYPYDGYPNLFRSTNKARSFRWLGVEGLTQNEPWPWVTPLDVAGPTDTRATSMYIASNRLYRSFNAGDSWTLISDYLTTSDPVSVIEGKAVDSTVFMYVGTSDGRIYRSVDAAAATVSWTEITVGFGGGNVSDIDFLAIDPMQVYATRSEFGGAHLYRSSDGGSNWQPVGSGLPNIPANAVAVDPLNPDRIFVGTDVGVFMSLNSGSDFTPFNQGMPLGNVITDLEIDDQPYALTAASYGRGAWQVLFPQTFDVPFAAAFEKQPGPKEIALIHEIDMVNPYAVDLEVDLAMVDAEGRDLGHKQLVVPSFGHVRVPSTEITVQSVLGGKWSLDGVTPPLFLLSSRDVDDQRFASVWPTNGDRQPDLTLTHLAADRARFFTSVAARSSRSSELSLVDTKRTTALGGLDEGSVFRAEIDDLYPQGLDVTWARLVASDPAARLDGIQAFGTWDGSKQLALLPLVQQPEVRVVYPHVAADTALFWTGLVTLNGNEQSASLTYTFYAASGESLGSISTNLAANTRQLILFDQSETTPESTPALAGSLPQGTAWVELQSSKPVYGFELFGSASPGADYMEGVRAVGTPWKQAVMPRLELGENRWTGFVLVNPSDNYQEVVLHVRDSQGVEQAAYLLGLNPRSKHTALLNQLFSATELSQAASIWIDVEKGSGLVGVTLYGDQVSPRRILAGCEMVPLP